jgi:hypothetical protein
MFRCARSGIGTPAHRRVGRGVLDAALNQRHRRGQLVRRRAETGLENRNDTLPEKKGIDGFTLHGSLDVTAQRYNCTTA